MNKASIIFGIIILFFLSNSMQAQDTIRLESKPIVILKSWYPEFKESPSLKIGEERILFTIIPDFENTTIYLNPIHLISNNNVIKIKETDKINQFLVSLQNTDSRYIEFEVWLELNDKTLLIKQGKNWVNCLDIYPSNKSAVLLETMQLKINQ